MVIYNLGQKTNNAPVNLASIHLDRAYFDAPGEEHLILIDIGEFTRLQDVFEFPKRAVAETLNPSQTPTAEFYEHLLFITVNHLERSTTLPHILTATEINIFLGKTNVMILFHDDFSKLSFATARQDQTNIYRALYTFLDAILDHNKKVIFEVEKDALALEDKVLRILQVDDAASKKRQKALPYTDPDVYMDELVKLRKELQFLKSFIEPTQDVFEILEADESELIPAHYHKYFQKPSLKADRLITYLTNLRDTIAQVRESWQAQVDLSFNKTAKLFTVVASIFLPLTLIAGWYGMNFTHMPELNSPLGYPIVFLLSLIVVVFCLWWFRKNHYI
ncbi:Magnesium and cobalt transport protein CorA [Clostridiaceae bacterium JG1575]|nr:Magnesium and cobalt transport protein CorA [Clostridiaceae bacterium JG1575]